MNRNPKNNGKVLIIEDNIQNMELLNDFVQAWGYQTLQAEQGMQGVRLVKNDKPDIILLDVMLPGMNGFEVCELLKSDVITRDIPVIMISALASPADKITGFNAGADNFLVKPINYKQLEALIRNLMVKKERLASMEERQIVLQKLYQCLAEKLGVNIDHLDEGNDFSMNCMKNLSLNKEERDKALEVLRFSSLLQVANNKMPKLVLETLEGLKCADWLVPLLYYLNGKEVNEENENWQAIKNMNLEKVARVCFVLNRYFVLLVNSKDNDEEAIKALKVDPAIVRYPSQYVSAVVQEEEDARLRQDWI